MKWEQMIGDHRLVDEHPKLRFIPAVGIPNIGNLSFGIREKVMQRHGRILTRIVNSVTLSARRRLEIMVVEQLESPPDRAVRRAILFPQKVFIPFTSTTYMMSNMKRILVVQSRTNPEWLAREQEDFRRVIGGGVVVEFLSSVDEKLAWSSPAEFLRDRDGVIFGGSADFDFHGGRDERDPVRLMSFIILSRVKNLISYALAEYMPLLGICYGHQLIANTYGGAVGHDTEQSKFGSYEVQLTEAGKIDRIFKDLPESFIAQYAHKDSVTKLPEGATLLASSKECRFSVLRYGEKAYTTQFHPEVTRFADLPQEYRDSAEASKIIPLWIERIVA